MTLSDVEDLKRKASGAKSGRNEEEGEEGEPTFIVTMDGIDEKYFKHQAKKVRVLTSVSDPYHWPGSGSASGNVDLDPCTKKKS